ncbi:MAG: hypothetical protein K1V96_08300 [Lachnospiraceae bacterium]
MNYQAFVPVPGIIRNISQIPNDCCNQMVSITTPNGPNNFFISSKTIVIGDTRLRPGMPIAAFYDSDLPVPLIYPPQYQAEIITPLRNNEIVTLKFFNRNLIASDNSLQLNLDRNTDISTLNGQRYSCSIGRNFLLVYYTVTTRSIPPQTTPRKIIVLCG